MYTIFNDRNQMVIDRLTEHFGVAIENDELLIDMLCLSVKKDLILDIIRFLKSEKDLDFNFLTTLCGMHFPVSNQLGVVYHLHSFIHNHRIRIKVTTSIDDPVIHSITSIWPAADWMEREAFDFFGIKFEGHPNLKRILNVEEMESFPLRKDFPLEDQTREDKVNSMFGR